MATTTVLNAVADTYINSDAPDSNYKNAIGNRPEGYLYLPGNGWKVSATSLCTLVYFKFPENKDFNGLNRKITSVRFSAVKKRAISFDGSQGATGARYNDYSGVLMTFSKSSGNVESSDNVTWNTCEQLTYINPEDYVQNNIISVGSVLPGERFTADITGSGVSFYTDYDYLILKLNGYTTGNKGMYYINEIEPGSAQLIIDSVSFFPTVKITSYPKSESVTHPATISWSYASETGLPQAKYTIKYSTDAGATWSDLYTGSGTETSYEIPANRMPAGRVYFRIRVEDTEGYSSESTFVSITFHEPLPIVTITDWNITNLIRVATLPLTWDYSSEDNFIQAKYTIQWSSNNGRTWTTIEKATDEQFYTFGIKAFPEGRIILRLKVTDSQGFESAWQTKEFTVYNQKPSVTIGYPSEITINNSNVIIFTWNIYEEIMRGQKSYRLMYSKDKGLRWTTITETTGNQFKEFPADTFPAGLIVWKIQVTDIDDNISEWKQTTFTAIGQTSAPKITNVTNSTSPTVTWAAESQDCYELNLRDSNNVLIYQSQLQIGKDVRSFKFPVMLDNGFYSVEIRVLNEFGVYTEWSSYSFRINLNPPAPPVDVFVYLESDYSVAIDGEGAPGITTYIVRRDEATGEVKILAPFIGNTVRDYTAALGKNYSYTLRSYGSGDTGGYADGEWTSINIPLDNHVIIHDNNNKERFVDLFKNNNGVWNISRKDAYSKTFRFTIGRAFPVVERTEWNTSVRTLNVWVSDEEVELLHSMHNSDVYYRGANESFLADMTITPGERYVGGGRFITIQLTRIEENEVSVL